MAPGLPVDPPAVARDPAVSRALWTAYEEKGAAYAPRTHHLQPDGRPKFVNRLILEASPYLIQHAHNPVDWRAWGGDALAEARTWDRPIFLSVGYATCHWCHVMEEESFDNEAVAQILNAHFIPVKVDREQHPAVDQIYITATQMQQGHAGWPNSVFLMPDGRPFHTGTYFPRPNFMQLLQAVAQLWRSGKRDEIERVAGQLSDAIRGLAPGAGAATPSSPRSRGSSSGSSSGSGPGEEVHAAAVAQLAEMHNEAEGGFSTTQQFPQEGFLLYLLDHWRRTGETRALRLAARTLEAIAAGGIHDHVGGGFHRYTVDSNWRTPHFEKMLYTQAQLARAFLEGWEATGHPAWRRAAERAFAYVQRDMTDAAGAFYSAEDADSPGGSGEREEGAFYVWPPEAVRAALGRDSPGDAALAVEALGLDEPPTIEAGPVAHLDPTESVDFARLDPLLARLRQARESRPRPLRDGKVIAGWNGLMIRALAEGAVAFETPAHAEAAGRAAEALWSRLWTGERLMRLWAGDRAYEDAVLEDYAWAGLGLLALWDATGSEIWRERAATLARAALGLFADGTGRLRMAADDGPVGPVYDSADGATPSGESAMLELLARLDRRLGDPDFRSEAERLAGALSGQLAQAPLLRPDALVAARVLDAGESALRRALAGGAVRACLAAGGTRLTLEIAEGWHINAPDPGVEGLVGARLEGAGADWPKCRARELGFSDRPVRVHEGRVEVSLAPRTEVISLTLQPCSETACLAPETAAFRLR